MGSVWMIVILTAVLNGKCIFISTFWSGKSDSPILSFSTPSIQPCHNRLYCMLYWGGLIGRLGRSKKKNSPFATFCPITKLWWDLSSLPLHMCRSTWLYVFQNGPCNSIKHTLLPDTSYGSGNRQQNLTKLGDTPARRRDGANWVMQSPGSFHFGGVQGLSWIL